MKPELHAFHETLAPIWHTNLATIASRGVRQPERPHGRRLPSATPGYQASRPLKTACGHARQKDVESKLHGATSFHKLAEQK